MYSKEQIFKVLETALGYTKGHKARVEVVSRSEGLSRIANSEIHQNVYEENTSLSISIIEAHKASNITTNILTNAGIAAAVEEAIANLELLPEGEAQPELVATPIELETLRFNDQLDAAAGVLPRAKMVADGLALIEAPYKAFGRFSYETLSRGIANSAGITRFSKANQVSLSLIVSDTSGGTGLSLRIAHTPEEIDCSAVFAEALAKAKANHNPIELQPGAYTVILEPQAVMDLTMQALLFGFSGTMVANKVSPLADAMGVKVFSDKLTIVDDWCDPRVPGDAFDSQGTPKQKLTLMENGVVKSFANDQLSALKLATVSSGHALSAMGMSLAAPTNVVIMGGEQTLDQIIAGSDRALLVSRFHYMNAVNMRQAQMTGITRDGFFLVEDGKITHALHNMRFTESLLVALNNIVAISSDRINFSEIFAALSTPAMKIDGFHFTGKTTLGDAPGS